MEASQKLEQKSTQHHTLTSESITLILAEYHALRDEMLKRKQMQHQFISLALIAPSTLLAFGLQTKDSVLILLYPILAMFVAVAWINQDHAVMLIGAYIREGIEPKVGKENMNWEHFIYKHYTTVGKLRGSLNIWAIRGIILGTELLAILVGLTIEPLNFSSKLILVIDIVSMLMTILVLRRRRIKALATNPY